jgi:ABC-type antimicrobial peptide transport system permease subunit
VSEAFARQMLNGADPIGRSIRRGPKGPLITIVGVVGDVRRDGKLEKLEPQVYLPAAQTGSYPVRLADVAVRTSGDAKALVPEFQKAIWSIDPAQPVTSVLMLDDVLFQRGAAQRFRALLFGMCALLALVLSLVGVYGVVSYAVSQRTPEIGVRMALGAARGDILRWLVGGTAGLVAGGAITGLVLARLLAHTLDSLLFGITSSDTATYVAAAASLSVVAIGAAMLAARRATLIDPSRALRGD